MPNEPISAAPQPTTVPAQSLRSTHAPSTWPTNAEMIEARKAYEPTPRSAQARATMTIPAQSARERRGSGNVVTAVPGASRADMSGAALTSSSEPVT